MSAKVEGRYTFSLDGESFKGFYETKEEAIHEGREYAADMEKECFYVGIACDAFYPSVDVDLIIENISDNASSEYGDAGDDYLCDVPAEQLYELEQKMNDVLSDWIQKYNYSPGFCHVENVEKIVVKELNNESK